MLKHFYLKKNGLRKLSTHFQLSLWLSLVAMRVRKSAFPPFLHSVVGRRVTPADMKRNVNMGFCVARIM